MHAIMKMEYEAPLYFNFGIGASFKKAYEKSNLD